MSEPIWTTVQIRCPATWNGPTVTRFYAFDPGRTFEVTEPPPPFKDFPLLNGETDWRPDDSVWLFTGEGNYGLGDSDLEPIFEWCHRHKVPYKASDDTKYEFAGETRIYDPRRSEVITFTNDGIDGGAVFSLSDYLPVKDKDATAVGQAVIDHFAQDIDITTIPIDHLPGQCPQDEEE